MPLEPGRVRIYSCGPTVYAYPAHPATSHAYVFADASPARAGWKGYEVDHVVNITDVGHLTSDMDEGEDKLELASEREGRSVSDIAAHYTDVFMQDYREVASAPVRPLAEGDGPHPADDRVRARARGEGLRVRARGRTLLRHLEGARLRKAHSSTSRVSRRVRVRPPSRSKRNRQTSPSGALRRRTPCA